jgi:hypothetical protein
MENGRPRSYPLRLAVHYQTRDGHTGTGVIIDITSRSARMELERCLPILTEMRLWVAWPVKLNNTTPLQLRMNARVISVDDRYTTVLFGSHEFVTVARRSAATAM